MEIHKLNREIQGCKRCGLHLSRTRAICGEGNLKAKIMLIAQAPGEKEDREGVMFIGPSGQVLEELLSQAGITREEIYMTNLIKCMLPKYRRPKEEEIKACSYYLDREIEIIDPQVLVPLGYYASKYILGKYGFPIPSKKEFPGISGQLLPAKDRKILVLPHPAVLLHNPEFKEYMTKSYMKLSTLISTS